MITNERAVLQRCVFCVMDTSDEYIRFDESGQCNHCRDLSLRLEHLRYFDKLYCDSKFDESIDKIRRHGSGKDYDCIIGLSGGVDSSYLAYKAKDWGLRPLLLHIDTGWNSELAVANIEKLVNYCGFDLFTHVVDWKEMRSLQLAFLRSGISNQDVPQDHIIFSSLYHYAVENDIRCILSGGNIATEGIFPASWHGSAMDAINLKAIFQQYGSGRLEKYKTISFFEYYVWYPIIKKMYTFRPLNFIRYNKLDAIREMEGAIGWRSYPRKHGESQFSKVFQNYYLPARFGYDKRLPHFSSMIVSGLISRDVALQELEEPLYNSDELEIDLDFFCKKLKISRDHLSQLMLEPHRDYSDFPNWDARHAILKNMQLFAEKIVGRSIKYYS